MRNCPQCLTRTMVRIIGDGRVLFQCPCGHKVEGGDEDRLVRAAGGSVTYQADKYDTLLRNAAQSRTMMRVEADCEKCGLPYMAQVRVGDEETIIRSCKCGFRQEINT